MSDVKRVFKRLDSIVEYLGLGLLLAMVLIITWQVFSRWVLNTTPAWSEEISLIFMVWLSFIGIAVGFREGGHVAIEVLVNRFPEAVRRWISRTVCVVTFVFGLYLLVEGWSFTLQTSMASLPSTGLPRSALYVEMPVAGLMICIYSALQFFGVDTVKYRLDAEAEDSAAEGVASIPQDKLVE